MTRGEKIVAFIEAYCKIPEGAQVGQPMKLMKFQKQFIQDVYDNPHGTSRAYLSVARKNGKPALIAAVALAHNVGPEAKQNSQIISGARSRDQASLSDLKKRYGSSQGGATHVVILWYSFGVGNNTTQYYAN